MILSHLTKHLQILLALGDESILSLRRPLIAVKSQHVHAVVAWIAVEQSLCRQVLLAAWRVGPHDIVKPVVQQLVLHHVPQGFIFLHRAELLAPPEPATRVLVPRTEHEGDFLSLRCLQRCEEIAQALHPRLEEVIFLTALKDILHNGSVAHIPGRSLREFLSSQAAALNRGQRVARMPADGDDAPTLMVGNDFLSDLGKGHAVEALHVAHLNTAELETHHGRIVAASILHITRIILIFPGQSVERIVLMTEHDTFLAERVESLHQLLSLRLFRFSLLLCGAGGYSYRCRCHEQ